MYITVKSTKVELKASNSNPMVTNNYRDRYDARRAATSLRKTLISVKQNPKLANKRIKVNEVTPGNYTFHVISRNGGKLASSVRTYKSMAGIKRAIINCVNNSTEIRIMEV